jgi:DinB superfamily
MEIRAALKSQYHASLKTLRLAVDQCPDALWQDPSDGFAAFWRVAYHTLFFTHLYLQKNEHSFTPWELHRDEANYLGSLRWENNRSPKPCEPYTRGDILAYWRFCDGMIDSSVDALDLSAPECGFPWCPMSKLEHQLVNIRHIQHHAATLATRLRRDAGVDVEWVGLA